MGKEQEGVDLLMKHKVWSYQYPQDKKRKNNRHARSPWGAKLSAAARPIANPQRFLQAAVADRLPAPTGCWTDSTGAIPKLKKNQENAAF